jgi:predicted GNAT family N-acyltransferase
MTARAGAPAVVPGDASAALAANDAVEDGVAGALEAGADPVHGEVAPADVRVGDPIAASLRLHGDDVPAQVWRISPLAVEVVRTPALARLAMGGAVDVTLRIGASETTFRGARVVASRAEQGRELVALRWPEPAPAAPGSEKRAASRWSCCGDYVPTGVAPNAARFCDHLHFRIVEISRTGMRLVTSLRNKFLVPGVSFEATCAFPTVGEARIAFRVVHARVVSHGGKKVLSLGTTFAADDPRTIERIAQYLLQFGEGTTVEELRATGFLVRTSSRAVEFGWVRTEEEYGEVLALRRLAYVHAKKASEDVKDVEMGDGFDASSRILYARHNGRIVASVRLMFPKSPTDPLKHEEYRKLPAWLPPHDQLVEASKACTHPDYRGGDLFYRFMMLAALTTMQARRKFILMSCTPSLRRVYEKLGFRAVGAEYVHPSMRSVHQLLIIEVAEVIAARGLDPISWNLTGCSAVYEFARHCGIYRPSRWRDARVAFYRLFEPLATALEPIVSRRMAARRR